MSIDQKDMFLGQFLMDNCMVFTVFAQSVGVVPYQWLTRTPSAKTDEQRIGRTEMLSILDDVGQSARSMPVSWLSRAVYYNGEVFGWSHACAAVPARVI